MAVSVRGKVSWIAPAILLAGCAALVLSSTRAGMLSESDAAHMDSAVATLADDAAPVGLSVQTITWTFDASVVRWLWWPLLVYLFWGMAYICDDFFVRTIEVISERFDIPDDVAGATLMALGCNGPEMALNTISIFQKSDIGVGAVVGGEVFNVLVIIGTALLATPDKYMPLKIGQFSFFRDVFFYVLSVFMLYLVLKDGMISRIESICLLFGCVVYSTSVALSSKMRSLLHAIKGKTLRRDTVRPSIKRKASSIHELMSNADEDSDGEGEVEPAVIAQWTDAQHCSVPHEGSVIGLRAEVRSRLTDKANRAQERYVFVGERALMVSAGVDPLCHSRAQAGMVFEYTSKTQGSWHYGGLVNDPCMLGISGVQNDDPLLSLADEIPQPAKKLGLDHVPWEIIPFDDILYCDQVSGDGQMFTLHIFPHNDTRDEEVEYGRLLTVEFYTKDAAVHDEWVKEIFSHLKVRPRRNAADHAPTKTLTMVLMDVVAWFQQPVRLLAELTIPDMDNPALQRWYPVAFVMSMAWLAVFAYLVVGACEGIHQDFGISNSILGFTVAAAGTSFPNVFSGMVVSRQGKTTMALANALGANIQNVFLALALPWMIQSCCITHGPFPMKLAGLTSQILGIYITLLPLVLVYVCSGSTMPRWSGWLYLVIYIIYVFVSIAQELHIF